MFRNNFNQNPYGYQGMQNQMGFDAQQMDYELGDLNRKISELSMRLSKIESYLGIKEQTNASNYENNAFKNY